MTNHKQINSAKERKSFWRARNKNQEGFIPMLILLTLIIVVLIAVVYLRVSHNQK